MTSDKDLKLLRACIGEWQSKREAAEEDDVDEPSWFEPFISMEADLVSGRWPCLTEKQRRWVKGVHEHLFDEPQYENLFSSGKLIVRPTKGRVALAPILTDEGS